MFKKLFTRLISEITNQNLVIKGISVTVEKIP